MLTASYSPDCLMCILAQIKCVPVPKREIEERKSLENGTSNVSILSQDLPQYPEDEGDILSSWEARSDQCKAMTGIVPWRKDSCSRNRWCQDLEIIRLDYYSSFGMPFVDIGLEWSKLTLFMKDFNP
jgi:hypothetical protein